MQTSSSTLSAPKPKRQLLLLLEQLRDVENNDSSQRLDSMLSAVHEADIADVMETIPRNERLTLWERLPMTLKSDVLLELSERVLQDLLPQIPEEQTAELMQQMTGDDVASLLRDISPELSGRLIRRAGLVNNIELRTSLAFADDTVGALMGFDSVIADETDTVDDLCNRLRKRGELPSHCDKLFVVDTLSRLVGVLPLKRLLLYPPTSLAREIMVTEDLHFFRTEESIEKAASAFERYDLISAPVLTDTHQIVGRLTIDEILDHLQKNRELGLLNSAGVTEEEDLFASLPRRFTNRWRWLLVNLVAAFFISRVVGLFESTIVNVVALASLMPIVAGMSGNVGNQTATLTVRALALEQIDRTNWRAVVWGEIALSLINGLVWGGLVGCFAYLLYERLDLALVLVVAMIFSFFAASVTGFFFPLLMKRIGKDPALGASVVLTSVVDTLGFFVFLSLGAIFLL
jgi:magnesium transporter